MYQLLDLLNNNRIFWGVTMLLLNLGSRFVVADLGKFHETILANEYFKKIILFSMFFVATRDILAAFVLTILYIIIIDGLLHEKRKYCIIPKKYIDTIKNKQDITENQYLQAKQIVLGYEMKDKQIKQEQDIQMHKSPVKTSLETYMNNVKLLNKIG